MFFFKRTLLFHVDLIAFINPECFIYKVSNCTSIYFNSFYVNRRLHLSKFSIYDLSLIYMVLKCYEHDVAAFGKCQSVPVSLSGYKVNNLFVNIK